MNYKHRSYRVLFSIFFLICSLIYFASPATAQKADVELFLVAQKAFEDGFYDLAISYIEQLNSQYPETEKKVQADLLLGQCYFFKSQYLKAYEIFQPLLEKTEHKDATLYWLGETHLKAGSYAEAEENYKQLVDIYPNSAYTPQAYYSLGWVHFEQGKYKKAKTILKKLIETAPNHQLIEDAAFKIGETEYNQQNYKEAIEYYKSYLKKYPKSTRHPEAYFYIAESYYYLENYLDSVTYYAKVADVSFDNKLILMAKVSLGWGYLRLQKYDLAKRYFDEALEFSKDKGILSDDVFLGQANLYSEMKSYDNALKAYVQLIENFPKSKRLADAYLGKGNSYYLLEKYTKAILAYQAVIDRYGASEQHVPMVEKAYFGIAWAYLKSGNIDASIEKFEAIKNLSSNNTVKISAFTQIGDAYQDVEQYEKAINIYDQILKEFPDSIYTDYVQYRQGIALLKMGEIKAATMSFQSLETNFPNSSYINDTKYYLAVAYFKNQQWGIAKDHIQKFINHIQKDEKNEFLEEAYYIFGLSLYGLKEYDESREIFLKIIKNYPQNSGLVKNSELNIAKCIYQKGSFKEALKQFQTIVNKHPQSEAAQEALIWLGEHYLETAQFDQAISYYDQFITRYPGSDKIGTVYYELAQTHQAKGDFDKAIAVYKTITISHGREVYVKSQLAIADIFSLEANTDASIETYQSIIQDSPEFKRDAYAKMATVYKNLKNYEKAISSYKNALQSEQGPSKINAAEIQFYIADTYELLNDPQKALEAYFKIPYVYTKNTGWIIRSYLRIARIFEDEEKWEEAEKIYKKIIEYNTDELKFAKERLEWIKDNIIP